MTATDQGYSPRAELWVLRIVVAAVGIGCLTVIVTHKTMVSDRSLLPDWFHEVMSITLLTPIVVGVATAWLGLANLRRLAGALVVLYLGVLFTQVVANTVAPASAAIRQVPWVLSATAIATTLAVVARGRRTAACVLVAATAMVEAARLTSASFTLTSLVNDVQAATTGTVVLVIVGALVQAARSYDDLASAECAAEADRAAQDARDAARRRAQALVHDEVLATLLLARQAVPELGAAVASQAARCLRLVGEMAEPAEHEPLPSDRLVERLRAIVAEIAPNASVREEGVRRLLLVPPDAAAALADATRQALVNSARHATSARRVVEIHHATPGLRIAVCDDGPGFDPAAVARDRMGVSVSIVGRMEAVPGGSARVSSRPGGGTVVALGWHRAEPDPASDRTEAPLTPQAHLGGTVPLLLAAFLGTHLLLAVLVARAGIGWPSYAGLAGVVLGTAALGWRRLDIPSPARTVMTVIACVATAGVPWLPHAARLGYPGAWYLTGSAFVLMALAARGRPLAALAGIAAATAIGLVRLAAGQHLGGHDAAAVVRPAVVVLVASGYTLVTLRACREIERLRLRQLAAHEERAWQEARDVELRERAEFLAETVGAMMTRLAGPEPLTEEDRLGCGALEGRLRDVYRGGRLARQPLTDAATAARRRGVDVVFLDDAPGHHLAEETLDAIVRWMHGHLDRIGSGRFTGRILPPGRGALASAVAGDESTLFRG